MNEATGPLSCGRYLVDSDTSLARSGVFPSGSLSVVRTTDEDGDVTLSFTDRLGRAILERRLDGDLCLDTHYVYDDLGLTRYVLTPEASAAMSSDGTFGDSSAPVAGLSYVYKYDSKGRCSSKRPPGHSPVIYKYDKGDEPVFSQDGRMRERGEWMFSFRDALGREAVSGIWPSSRTPDTDGTTVIATYTGAASLGGYSVNVQTPAIGVPLSVNYYDGHSFLENLRLSDTDRLALSPDTLSAYGVPVTGSNRLKGLQTGSAVRSVTDPESVTVSAFYYDRRGRQIQSHHLEALGGRRHIHQSLTFTGRPLRTRETVEFPDGRTDSLVTSRLYDSQERLVSETSSLNGKSQTVAYSYDGIGRLTGRSYSSGDGSHSLSESLTYDIRDQLTGLSSDVFSMSLRRQEPVLGTTPRYNGNISEWEWSRRAGSEAAAWSLSYDGTGRLKDARRFAGEASTNALCERGITYDRNGNILSLTRYGADTAVPEEALAYSYNGNMLAGVSNSGSSGGGGAYDHDANGNLTRDGLSGLDIRYDDMNLTSRISSGDTTLAEYGHLADGTKIRSVDGAGNGLQYRGALVYAQTAGQSGPPTLTLDCALTTAGRIVRETAANGSASYKSLIHLRDHLGSVRAVIDGDTGTAIEANDYYPFGKRIPLPVSGAVPVTEPVEVTRTLEVTVASTSSATATGSATSQNRWLFSGKESQSFLSASIPLLDFGARMYDPITARWTAQDPLAEKYYAVSPYAYCLGNPISHIDDDGQMPQVVAGAIIGAAIEGVIAAVEGKSLREIGGAVVGGAVEGALVSLTGGMSLLGTKAVSSVLSAGIAGAVGSSTSQAIGKGSIDAMQVAADAIGGMAGGAVSTAAKSAAQYAGGKMAARAEEKYSSKAMKSSVRKEVKKEMIRTGVNPAGKAGGRKLKKEVNDRIANDLRFELSIANAIKDTKAGDVAGSISAHRISHVIYDKEE